MKKRFSEEQNLSILTEADAGATGKDVCGRHGISENTFYGWKAKFGGMVHFYRNIFSHVPSGKVRDVTHMLKAIHAQESRKTAQEKADAVVADLRRRRMTKAAELIAEAIGETPTYDAFPDSHWRKIRTNNPLERIMREIRRRTRVVGAFPDGHIAAGKWSTCKDINTTPLHAQQNQTEEAVA